MIPRWLGTAWKILTSYYGMSLAIFFVLLGLGFMAGSMEDVFPISVWLFNPYTAILIPAGLTAFRLWRHKRRHKSNENVKVGTRISNLVALGILMTIVESLSFTFGFISGLFVESLLFDVHVKIPWTVAEMYVYMYIMIPLAASFYELQLGQRHTLLGMIYDRIKQRLPFGARRAAQRFYRLVQIPV